MSYADSGAQPPPHYCEHNPMDRGEGCPRWPGCLSANLRAALDDEPEPDDDDEIPELAQTLCALFGFAVGAVLFLIVVALLLPVLL